MQKFFMNKKTFLIIATLIFVILIFFLVKNKQNFVNKPATVLTNQLQIISTNPNPLDEATILPTDSIEITLNKPVVVSELKHRFDPDIEHEIKVIKGINNSYGQTFRIIFKKPLPLGGGFTLFILKETHTEEKQLIDKEYIFHFKTIKYNGV